MRDGIINPVDFDLIVVGGGPVGLALARAARELSVAVVAPQARSRPPQEPAGYDPRVYAVSPGNVGFLNDLRVWQGLPQARLTPVHAMRVFGDGDSEIGFDAYRAGVPELAWTVEDSALQQGLWQAVEAAEHVKVFAPAECAALTVEGTHAVLRLRDGRTLTAALVVGADGARSFVREQAGIAAAERDYGQFAMAANFRCEKPHRNTAWQWFQGGPVLALLPLPGERVSMIWSLAADDASRIDQLEPDALCREVEHASRHRLGALALETAPRSYPLRRLRAHRLSAPRTALVGDAAHVIHPLAGQGLNLGLQDVRCLAGVLAEREHARDAGDARRLRRYERRRAEPILAMDSMVDGLFRLFASESPAASRLRNTGLNLTGRVPVLKGLLMRHAMS
jgi:ubiquinone biosynthesis UbiH/UbiF/VisC/COQ6 family hydroxylase